MTNSKSRKSTESMYDYVMRMLQETKGDWGTVAVQTGISRRTIEKIARRSVVDPGVSFVQRLSDYFEEREAYEQRLARQRVSHERADVPID